MNKCKRLFFSIIVGILFSGNLLAHPITHAAPSSFHPSVKPQKEVYKIASDSSFAPFVFQKAETKEYTGIDVDIITRIAELSGFKVEINFVGFQGAVNMVKNNQADGIISGMGITEDRKKSFDFSDSYYESYLTLAVKKGNLEQIKNYNDLKGKKVAAKIGTLSADFLTKHEAEYGYHLKLFPAADKLYAGLISGGVTAIMDDDPVVSYAITQGQALEKVGKKEPVGSFGFGVKKNKNPELITLFNDGLKYLKETGEYAKIIAKYTSPASKKVDESTFLGLIRANYKVLLEGLGITLLLALLSFLFAFIIGIFFGIMSMSRYKGLNRFTAVYVDIIRGIPLMVLVIFIFFGIPSLVGHPINDFVAGIIALTLNASAYISEIVRGGIRAVPIGQSEAARSLGLTPLKTMQKIILPQALRLMTPALVNQFVISLKDTTIISVIGVIELLQASQIVVARNLQSFQMYLIVALIYLVVITSLTKLGKSLEEKVK